MIESNTLLKPARAVGIIGYGAYVPRYRLPAKEVARVWTGGKTSGLPIKEKAVPGQDEDVVTMSLEAVRNAMKRAGIDMLDPAEGLPVIRNALIAGYSGEAVVGRRLGILVKPFDDNGGLEPDGSLQARSKDKSLPLPFDKVTHNLHDGHFGMG